MTSSSSEPLTSALVRSQPQPDLDPYLYSHSDQQQQQQYSSTKYPDSNLEFESSELFSRRDSGTNNSQPGPGSCSASTSLQYSMLSLSKSVIKPEMYRLTFDVNPSTMLMDDCNSTTVTGNHRDPHTSEDDRPEDEDLDDLDDDSEYKKIILNSSEYLESQSKHVNNSVYTIQPTGASGATNTISSSPDVATIDARPIQISHSHQKRQKKNILVTRLLSSGQISTHALNPSGSSAVPACCCSLM